MQGLVWILLLIGLFILIGTVVLTRGRARILRRDAMERVRQELESHGEPSAGSPGRRSTSYEGIHGSFVRRTSP